MSNSEQETKNRLRLEARALEWDTLSKSQQDAFRRIVESLANASDSANDEEENRRSRVLLVSGPRGSGKTTLVLSVQHYCTQQQDFREQYDREINKTLSTYGEHLIWLKPLNMDPLPKNTSLLGAILARIAYAGQKHERHMRGDRGRASYGQLDPQNEQDRALNEFEGFQCDALLALEGNLEQRAAQLDTDVYAIEITRSERQKVTFNHRFNQMLKEIVRQKGASDSKAVFVLPIDDFDANPKRAIEVLSLVNNISIPRLFTVFMGAIDKVDQVLYYQIRGEYNSLLGEANDEDARERIASNANENASSSLRKMLPPAQRIMLSPMSMTEVLEYRQQGDQGKGDAEKPLEELLTQVCLRASGLKPETKGEEELTYAYDGKVDSLKRLLLIEDPIIKHSIEDNSKQNSYKYAYDASEVLRAPTRQLADFWLELSEFLNWVAEKKVTPPGQTAVEWHGKDAKGYLNDEGKSKLVALFQKTMLNLVDEDPNLDVDAQEILRQSTVQNELNGDWELYWSGLEKVLRKGDKLTLAPGQRRQSETRGNTSWHEQFDCQIHASRIRRIDIQIPREGKPRVLSPRTKAAFSILHDMILFTGAGVVAGSGTPEPEYVAYAEWDDGRSSPLHVAWPMPEWSTSWHADLFLRIWNAGEIRARTIARDPSELKDDKISLLLAYAWILGGVVALSGELDKIDELVQPLTASRPKENLWTDGCLGFREAWNQLANSVEKLASEVSQSREKSRDDLRADQIDSWFVDLACLLAPEAGIPWSTKESSNSNSDGRWLNFRSEVFSDQQFMKLWPRLSRKIRKRRLAQIGDRALTWLGLSFVCPTIVSEVGNKRQNDYLDENVKDLCRDMLADKFNSKEYDLCPREREVKSRIERGIQHKASDINRSERLDVRAGLGLSAAEAAKEKEQP